MVNQKELHNKIYAGEPVIGHRKMSYVSEKFVKDMDMLADVKGDEKVLDVGSGDGKFSNTYPENVIAMDLAKEAGLHTKAPFVTGNALSLPFKSSSFDKVYCQEVIEHFPDQSFVRTAIKEIWRVLKPGGLAIVSTPNENSLVAMIRKTIKGYKEPPGSIHTSMVSLHALRKISTNQGFRVKKTKTYLLPLPIPKYDYNMPSSGMKVLYPLGKFFPKLAHGIIIKMQKPAN